LLGISKIERFGILLVKESIRDWIGRYLANQIISRRVNKKLDLRVFISVIFNDLQNIIFYKLPVFSL